MKNARCPDCGCKQFETVRVDTATMRAGFKTPGEARVWVEHWALLACRGCGTEVEVLDRKVEVTPPEPGTEIELPPPPCPACGNETSQTYSTYNDKKGRPAYRYRRCNRCKHQYRTKVTFLPSGGIADGRPGAHDDWYG